MGEAVESAQEERAEVNSHLREWGKWGGSAELGPVMLTMLLSPGHSATGTENVALRISPRQGGAKPNPLAE